MGTEAALSSAEQVHGAGCEALVCAGAAAHQNSPRGWCGVRAL